MSLPYFERILMLSINPDAATRDDVAMMASDLMEKNRLLGLLKRNCIRSIEIGLESVREELRMRDIALGRVRLKDKLLAKQTEQDIKNMERTLEELSKLNDDELAKPA